MKWPFVRRTRYEYLIKCLDNKNDIIADQMDNIKSQFIEINRLNQELANELNSHRETKKMWHESLAHNDLFLNKIKDLEKELKETKEQKNGLSNEYDIINNELYHIKEELRETKDALKIAQEENEKINIVLDKWLFAIKTCVEQINKTKSEYLKKL